MIAASQIKAARALLGLSQRDLAALASVGLATVQRIELATDLRGAADTHWKIQTALEEAGVEFIPPDDTKGPGLRLKHK
jgi:transcriptional regulator with XRE-family HTH domain